MDENQPDYIETVEFYPRIEMNILSNDKKEKKPRIFY